MIKIINSLGRINLLIYRIATDRFFALGTLFINSNFIGFGNVDIFDFVSGIHSLITGNIGFMRVKAKLVASLPVGRIDNSLSPGNLSNSLHSPTYN